MAAPPTLRLYRLPEETVKSFTVSRDRGHVEVMRGFPPDLGPTPRSRGAILWRLDAASALLAVQSVNLVPNYPQWEKVGELEVATPPGGSSLSFQLSLACQKTPPSPVPEHLRQAVKQGRAQAQAQRRSVLEASGAVVPETPPRGSYRSKKIIVPEGERPEWFRGRMEKIGLNVVGDPDISRLERARLGRKRGTVPFVNVGFTAEVTDQEALAKAIETGVGAAKSYGLGLLLVSQPLHTDQQQTR